MNKSVRLYFFLCHQPLSEETKIKEKSKVEEVNKTFSFKVNLGCFSPLLPRILETNGFTCLPKYSTTVARASKTVEPVLSSRIEPK